MAVLLVLATFLVFIIIDFVLTRKQKTAQLEVPTQPATAVPMLSSASIEGIMLPDQLRYHPGHTWLFEERPKLARVGVDALAIRVIRPVDKVEVPKLGRWVRQGQKAFTFWSGDEKVELVSPVEGEVCEINAQVVNNPSLAAKDPYGSGWLVKVNVPERETVDRNLLPRTLVRTWMKEEVRRVREAQPQLARVAVMGGDTVSTTVHDQNWRELAHHVFLS